MIQKNINIHKNTNLNPYLTSHTKVILKWITDPNIKTKNIKLLGNGEMICALEVGKGF